MPRRSKIAIAGYADQVKLWLEEGKTETWIAAQLKERDSSKKFTQQDVNRFKDSVLKRVETPETRISKEWNKDAADALAIVQEAVDYVLQQPIESKWDGGTQSTIMAKMAVAREKLRLLGQYPKEGGVVVAVQVNVKEAKEKLWAILNEGGE